MSFGKGFVLDEKDVGDVVENFAGQGESFDTANAFYECDDDSPDE